MLVKLNVNVDDENQLITIEKDKRNGYFNFALLNSNARMISFKNLRTFQELIDVFVMLWCNSYSLVEINNRLEHQIKKIFEKWFDETKEYSLEVQA